MRVLFATAEFTPVVRVGGLAEATAGLVHALRAEGADVEVVLPDYNGIELADEVAVHVSVPAWVGDVRVRRGRHAVAGDLTLVHVPGIERPHPYVDEDGQGWPDNDHRFMSFSAVVAALATATGPDILHLNDWHTAAAVGMLHDRPPTVLTIHTLGYQGVTHRGWLERLPVDAHRFAWYDATNPLAGAIELVDRVIAVSPNYAAEILTPEAGMGLDGRLAALGDRLVGIRNGIDTSLWDPAIDHHIATTFDRDRLDHRDRCRAELAAVAGWSASTTPIAGMVTRLVEQKGIDLLLDALRFLPTMPARLVVLGAGSAELSRRLAAAAEDTPDSVWFLDGYDEALSHRIFAGSDLFVMPSRFEPCGLAQMQAMAYGSIPVVTDVGGLHDTVVDADRDRALGTGFVSRTVDSVGLVDALHRGVRAVRHAGRRRGLQARGMGRDWSWSAPAARHLELYADIGR
ncbi:MAG: glycogen/starch synthase [Acidimicrobiia bacterium]|nr:glycogen/starch synthase [Acidimicrobiia bacterium]